MSSRQTLLWLAGVCLLVGPGTWRAQAQFVPQSVEEALGGMSQNAAIVFEGVVRAVRRPDAAHNGSGAVVEIDFDVTQAVRGVSGATYTLKEWAGLWAGTDEPLRPGQRYLMLLHAPNAAGLSSPVLGSDGAIPIHGSGIPAQIAGEAARARAAHGTAAVSAPAAESAGSPAGEVIDLGWIATHVVRPVVYAARAPRPVGGSPVGHADAVAPAGAAASPQPAQPSSQSVSVASAIELLQPAGSPR